MPNCFRQRLYCSPRNYIYMSRHESNQAHHTPCMPTSQDSNLRDGNHLCNTFLTFRTMPCAPPRLAQSSSSTAAAKPSPAGTVDRLHPGMMKPAPDSGLCSTHRCTVCQDTQSSSATSYWLTSASTAGVTKLCELSRWTQAMCHRLNIDKGEIGCTWVRLDVQHLFTQHLFTQHLFTCKRGKMQDSLVPCESSTQHRIWHLHVGVHRCC